MDILTYVDGAKKILIYGAGQYGRVVTKWLCLDNIFGKKIIGIAISAGQEKVIDKISNIQVKYIDEIDADKDTTLVIIALSEEKQDEIVSLCEGKGYSNIYKINKSLYNLMRREVNREESYRANLMSLNTKITSCTMEIVAAINFDRAMNESKWLRSKDFSAGRSAVSNYYLYTMYRILDSGQFYDALDIGMGQTSKMLGQYANFCDKFNHTIVEESQEWISVFSKSMKLSNNVNILQMDYTMENIDGEDVRVYEGFGEKLKDKKFDFISIDAPIGKDMKNRSRIDIFKIFPKCLKSSWIIMIDDVGRQGESNTLTEITDILEKNNHPYCLKIHEGIRKFAIIASEDNRCFCTI